MPLDLTNPFWKAYADNHEAWLSRFDPRHLANWRRILNDNNEAALCESGVRELLEEHGVTVEPNEKLEGQATGGPDFRCTVNGRHFYVEVTCVTRETATARTKLTGGDERGLIPFNAFGMAEAIFDECINKARQCGGQDAPTLVAVGTFHCDAGMLCFKKVALNSVLTGTTQIAWDVPVVAGLEASEPYQLTNLKKAAFIRPDRNEELGFARESISGLLICGLGSDPGRFLGVLHPNPARPFDCSLLPNVDFGSVTINRETQQMKVSWLQNDEEDADIDVEQYLQDHGLELPAWPGGDDEDE